MKRKLLLFTFIVPFLLLVGCTESTNEENSQNEENVEVGSNDKDQEHPKSDQQENQSEKEKEYSSPQEFVDNIMNRLELGDDKAKITEVLGEQYSKGFSEFYDKPTMEYFFNENYTLVESDATDGLNAVANGEHHVHVSVVTVDNEILAIYTHYLDESKENVIVHSSFYNEESTGTGEPVDKKEVVPVEDIQ